MRKILLVMLLIVTTFITPISPVSASENDSSDIKTSENIEDNQTPESPNKDNSLKIYLYLSAFAMLGVVAYLIKQNRHKLEIVLNVDSVKANGDGSYIVSFGYDNPDSAITFDEKDYGIRVIKGNAITLKRPNTNQFTSGKHKDEMIVVINEDSEIEYYVGNKKINVKGRDIIEKEEK